MAILLVPHFCACLLGGTLGPPAYFLGPRTCEDAAGVLVECCGIFSYLLVDTMLRLITTQKLCAGRDFSHLHRDHT